MANVKRAAAQIGLAKAACKRGDLVGAESHLAEAEKAMGDEEFWPGWLVNEATAVSRFLEAGGNV